jgi:sigma-B regulation protein RsbU (phosphoserine phosphatase)
MDAAGFVPKSPGSESVTRVRRAELETLMADLAQGAEYQRALLPAAPPSIPGYDLGFFYRGARQLSGDFYDFLPLPKGRWGIAIADASGKGTAAAILTMICRAMLRIQPDLAAPPAEVLANVNRLLLSTIKKGTFVSAIYLVLDPAAHALTVANAGHLPLVVWRSRARIATIHPSKGPVLGVLPASAYAAAQREERIALEPGDRFVLITDGVNEAMAPGQKEFGMEHLRRRLRAESDGPTAELLRHIVEQIEIHRGGGEQSDDITIVTGRRLP